MSKILIVDDEPTIVELLEEHLRSEGHATSHAYSGEEALQALEQSIPDLVILDLMLPGMDGYEVCRLMQQDPRTNHIPAIMLTARSAVPNKVLGFQRGADDYVVKPFDPEELSVRVRAQLHHLYHDTVSELTGLPGTRRIEEKIKERTSDSKSPWSIIYVDVANFTTYNEVYSFLEGDQMIKLVAEALTRAVQDISKPYTFIGHVGGDKFVVITEPQNVEAITSKAQEIFVEESRQFFSAGDRDQGFIATVNRQGLLAHVDLCKLVFDIVSSAE